LISRRSPDKGLGTRSFERERLPKNFEYVIVARLSSGPEREPLGKRDRSFAFLDQAVTIDAHLECEVVTRKR